MNYYKSYHRDPSLPDPGGSPLGPRLISQEAHEAVAACEDLHALAMLRGYLSSYFGVAGMVVISSGGLVVAALLGAQLLIIGFALALVVSVMVVMQVRRRARQWHSIVQARMDQLIAGMR